MNILLLGETIIDHDIFLKRREISSHTKKNKYILNKSKVEFGGASNLFRLLKRKKIFFFTNNFKYHKKNYKNISDTSIIKNRYWYKEKVIFQINNISDREKITLKKNFIKSLFAKLAKSKILIISDHNYGLIRDNILKKIVNYAKSKSITVYYDSQHRKKISNNYIPENVDFFLMNRDEFKLYLNYFKAKKLNKLNSLMFLKKKLKIKNIVLKEDKDGCVCLTTNNDRLIIKPIKNKKNLIGAGDRFLSALVMKNNEKNFFKKLVFCNKFAIS